LEYNGFSPENLTYDKGTRTDFSSFFGTQTEGLLISEDGSILISSEESSQKPATLFKVSVQN
jgi:hypothetical protein